MPYLDERYQQVVDQIPGNEPQGLIGRPQYEETPAERGQNWLARTFMSGGAGDIRNIAAALGPAAQAAGGLGQIAAWAQRAGVPAKVPVALDAADQMFDVTQAAPSMTGVGAAQGGSAMTKLLAGLGGGSAVASFLAMLGRDKKAETSGPGVSVPAAARTIQNRNDRIEAATDAATLPAEQFRAKWGADPEKILSQ
jgi:hypothetical protein